MNIFLLMIAMGLGTYLLRLSFILLLGKVQVSATVERILRFIPPTVLACIVFPAVLQTGGRVDISIHNERLLAALVALLVAWKTKNILYTIAVGMVLLWLLQAVL